MLMNVKNENLIMRVLIVQRIVDENYEPENQRKCKRQVFKRYIKPNYPMSERTFWRYMAVDVENELKENQK